MAFIVEQPYEDGELTVHQELRRRIAEKNNAEEDFEGEAVRTALRKQLRLYKTLNVQLSHKTLDQFIELLAGDDTDALTAFIRNEIGPRIKAKQGFNFVHVFNAYALCAGIVSVTYFIDQIENFAKWARKQDQEVKILRESMVQTSPTAEMASFVFQMHVSALQEIEDWWQAEHLPSLDFEQPINRTRTLNLLGLRTTEEAKTLAMRYLKEYRPAGMKEPRDPLHPFPEEVIKVVRDATKGNPRKFLETLGQVLEHAITNDERVIDLSLVDLRLLGRLQLSLHPLDEPGEERLRLELPRRQVSDEVGVARIPRCNMVLHRADDRRDQVGPVERPDEVADVRVLSDEPLKQLVVRLLLVLLQEADQLLPVVGERELVRLHRLVLRAAELASLTPKAFALDADTPTVTVQSGYSKRRRRDVLPLHAGVVNELRAWLGGKEPGEPLWGGTWAKYTQAVLLIRHDLAAARAAWLAESATPEERAKREQTDFLGYRDSAERVADFHSLRHRFVSELVRSGVGPKDAQELARHSTVTLTLGRYAHTTLTDTAAAVNKLPAVGGGGLGAAPGAADSDSGGGFGRTGEETDPPHGRLSPLAEILNSEGIEEDREAETTGEESTPRRIRYPCLMPWKIRRRRRSIRRALRNPVQSPSPTHSPCS